MIAVSILIVSSAVLQGLRQWGPSRGESMCLTAVLAR